MKLTRGTAVVVLALAIAGATRGQDAGPAASAPVAAKEPAVVARASIVSLDGLKKMLVELGVPDAANMHLEEDMENAPFLGKGTVATDKPIGITVVAGPQRRLLPIFDSLIFAVPLVAGKISEADLKAAGGKAVEGTPATYSLEEFIVRRAADYLFVKQEAGPFGLGAMPDAVFAPDYRDGTNLCALSLNLDLLRKISPEGYKELAKNIMDVPSIFGIGGGGGGGDDATPVTGVLDKIDRVSLALGQDEKNLHMKSWLAPSPVGAKAKEAPRPAFPAGMIVQMHLVYPTPEAAGFIEKQLATVPAEAFGGELAPAYHGRVKDLVLRAANLNTKTDAVSMGFAMKDGHAVFYIVDQFSADVDAGKELREIAEKGVALATEAATVKVPLETTTYEAGDKKVQRLTLSPAETKSKLVIDEVQVGKVAYVAISDNTDGKYVADLAAAGMNGNSSVLCAGAVDLGAAVTAALESGGMPGMTPDALQKLKAAYGGQAITWTVQASEQNFLYTDVTVPKVVIREWIKAENAPTRVEGNVGGAVMP